jgi:hypothetical protein
MSGTAQRLSNASYTRTNGGRQGANFPRFHMEAVEDPLASAAAGRPIYREEERVEIIMPGNPNSPVFRVSDDHRQEWPEAYERFRKGLEFSVDGTPIEQWNILGRKHVLELKAKDIHTVEQCAALSDLAVQQIGMGGLEIRKLAAAYLDDAEASKITTEALDRATRAESQLGAMQMQMDQMRQQMDGMFKELMTLKNSPSAVDSYVPGDHDPMQPHVGLQRAPEPIAMSSLAELAKRGPGRPRKEPA